MTQDILHTKGREEIAFQQKCHDIETDEFPLYFPAENPGTEMKKNLFFFSISQKHCATDLAQCRHGKWKFALNKGSTLYFFSMTGSHLT